MDCAWVGHVGKGVVRENGVGGNGVGDSMAMDGGGS